MHDYGGLERVRKAVLKWGRGSNSLRGEVKFSIKKNKKYLNRKARRHKEPLQGCLYKKLAGDMAYDYVT